MVGKSSAARDRFTAFPPILNVRRLLAREPLTPIVGWLISSGKPVCQDPPLAGWGERRVAVPTYFGAGRLAGFVFCRGSVGVGSAAPSISSTMRSHCAISAASCSLTQGVVALARSPRPRAAAAR
jgi:hypothetical protein